MNIIIEEKHMVVYVGPLLKTFKTCVSKYQVNVCRNLVLLLNYKEMINKRVYYSINEIECQMGRIFYCSFFSSFLL